MNDFWTAFSAVAAAFTLVGGAFALGQAAGYKRAKLDLNNERESRRFAEIYAPMMGLFVTRHVTMAGGGKSNGHLGRRLGKVLARLNRFKFSQAGAALLATEDDRVFGEIEYGGAFPLSKISTQLQGREQYADEKLIALVARADRAQYEDNPEEGALTDADIELFNHICEQHGLLARRFAGA